MVLSRVSGDPASGLEFIIAATDVAGGPIRAAAALRSLVKSLAAAAATVGIYCIADGLNILGLDPLLVLPPPGDTVGPAAYAAAATRCRGSYNFIKFCTPSELRSINFLISDSVLALCPPLVCFSRASRVSCKMISCAMLFVSPKRRNC